MTSVSIYLALAALLASSAGQDVTRFDLDCTGSSQKFDGQSAPSADRPWTRTFRVDLIEKSYCTGECPSVRRIARIQPDKLQFSDDGEEVSYVDRNSGKLTAVMTEGAIGRPVMTTVSATCVRKDFSGFARKF